MAVTLTASGIQFPDGSNQSVLGGYEIISEGTAIGGVTSYTWTGLSSSTKRILLMFNNTLYSSGPQTLSISCINSNGTTVPITAGRSEYLPVSTYGTAIASSTVTSQGGGTNLYLAQSYATFNVLWAEIVLVDDLTSIRKYTYDLWGTSAGNGYTHRANGYLSSSNYPITAITVNTQSVHTFVSPVVSLWAA